MIPESATVLPAAVPPSPEDCRGLLVRVLSSPQFRRSERQCDFLSFVCDLALTEPGSRIHETTIGCKVFGGIPGYDTGQDNIVRVNATDMRHRLKEYFSTGGAVESLLIELPKGSYRPLFVRRAVSEETPIPEDSPQPPVLAPSGLRKWLVWLALIVFGIGIGRFTFRLSAGPSQEPVKNSLVNAFWTRAFPAGKLIDVVMADASMTLYEDHMEQSVTINDYQSRAYLKGQPPEGMDNRVRGKIVSRHDTSVSDAYVVNRLTQSLASAGIARIAPHFARDYPAEGLLRNDVIVLGSSSGNPWALPFEARMNFRVQRDRTTGVAWILNEHPAANEQSRYGRQEVEGGAAESYAVVSLLPNLRNTGNVLLLAGVDSLGTRAAGEFVNDERWLRELDQRLGGGGDARAPPRAAPRQDGDRQDRDHCVPSPLIPYLP